MSAHVTAEAVDALAERWHLPPGSSERLIALVELLIADPHSATTVRDPYRAIDDHLADSLVALELGAVQEATAIADIGSGAGFPGLPLAIALPSARVALVESNARKCEYLRRAVELSSTGNATVVNARAEEWSAGLDRHDLVSARALAPLPAVAEYAAPLLKLGGTLVVWRGRPDPDAERQTMAAASELGLEVAAPVRVFPYSTAERRFLHQFRKTRATPSRFPRRPGVATKRPLGDTARHD